MAERPTLSVDKRALLQQRLRGIDPPLIAERVIPERPVHGWAPLSSAQRQMWLIDQMTPGNPAYNLPVGFRLRGRLSATALERGFNEVIKRHEILRTTFAFKGGEPVQIIHPELALIIKTTTLDCSSTEECDDILRSFASEEAATSFDLTRLPLMRVNLFEVGEAEHVLIINLHHIIADGLSVGVLLGELDAFYRRFAGEQEPRLPDVAVQYADYSQWQQQNMLRPDAYSNQVEYWQRRLQDAPAALELPADRTRPVLQSFRGSNVFFRISPKLAQALNELGASEGSTLFMTLLAAFEVLLQRYSMADDIVIGTPVTARTQHEVEALIGNFINMIALRCDVSGDPTFTELLRRTRDTTLNAFSNGDLPFEALLSHLKVERDTGRNPVFQVLFQVLSSSVPSIGDLEISSFHFDLKTAQFDLGLHLYEERRGLVGRFEYCAALFHAETVERWAANFERLLDAIVDNPEQRISTIALPGAAERDRIANEWNDTAIAFPVGLLMNELFEAQVQRAPARLAVIAGTTTHSYGELESRANRIARALRSRGIGRGQRVGLCVDRDAHMLAALLGILKAGAAYVPLDPSFPEERLRFMAEDAQLAMLVSTDALASSLGISRDCQLLLDADAPAIASEPDARLPVDDRSAQPQDPAYVIYTSGSTGKPKGVIVPHRAVVNFLLSMALEPGMVADDVLVAVTTLSFDIAVLELLLPLALGAAVVVASRDDTINGEALSALLGAHRATLMQATPSTWRLLLEAGWTCATPFKALVGGEAMSRDLADQLIGLGVELWNLYGPTETTVWSTRARIAETSGGITIGKPIANTTVWILDAQRSLCPLGVPGELCIGGAGVTLGYWNRPELTSDRFIPDPFSTTPLATLYRTGDRARWRNDGMLEHLGRLDDQVKVRGFRIELGEIETVLAEHPSVRQAAVHLWAPKANDVRIVACCVMTQGQTLAPINLRKHLRARLPEYMVPQHFLAVDTIPLTPNGKVDRRRLPIPIVTESRLGRHEVPVEPVEVTIARIWTELIGPAQPIGRFDKFFEVGGHSLLGVQALRQIEDELGVRLEFRLLFQESLADIAMRCRSERISCGNATLAG